jgi:hypothetical protein
VQIVVKALNQASGRGHNILMQTSRHPTATRRGLLALAAVIAGVLSVRAQDDPNDIRTTAKPATVPATVTAPDAPGMKPTVDALGTQKPKIPPDARAAKLVLSDGTKLEGQLWTNRAPFRVWTEGDKVYKDLDLGSIKKIEVHVLSETMEEDWRWLKEGSDQKVFSGRKYPNVSLAYQFTLTNDQVIEGTVVSMVYLADKDKTRTLVLYKQYKGNLDEALADLIYVKSIDLEGSAAAEEKKTTHLPLLD